MANVRQIKEEYLENCDKKVRIFNPTPVDFEYKWQARDYKIGAMDLVELDYYHGQHAKKHLIDHIINVRNLNPLHDRSGLEKEVEVLV